MSSAASASRWSASTGGRPPGGDPRLGALLARLEARRPEIDAANQRAFDLLVNGEPVLLDCRPAREAMELPDRTVLHAGPPLAWARTSPPVRAAILCAIRYEGWAANDDAAAELVMRGDVRLEPCHHRARRRADGRRAHAVDAGVHRREPRARQPRARDDQRGPRQGAALRRQRRVGDRAAQLARAGGRPVARRRAARVEGHRAAPAHGAGAADGRRDAPAQRRRVLAVRARAHAARGARRPTGITRWRGSRSSSRATTSSS